MGRALEEEFTDESTGKVPKVKLPTCVRGPLTRRIVNRGMCTSGRDLRKRANRPTHRTDPNNISVKICPHTKIEPVLLEDFSPRHLKSYQLAYAPESLENSNS
ncbi:hypothetical protein Fot_04369 [Forsythia ovata]|uniref:Uncharacterized protein n=1 Tax=Forsythia ovata TaxID=205694 RepID=A0ABD1XD72_9LAMI